MGEPNKEIPRLRAGPIALVGFHQVGNAEITGNHQEERND